MVAIVKFLSGLVYRNKILNDGVAFDGVETMTISDVNLIITLRKQIMSLYSKYISEDGSSVDYDLLSRSVEFNEYLKSSRQLKYFDLRQMDENNRKSFFINLYNIMVIHANIVHEQSLFSGVSFYFNNYYNVGGHLYNLMDVEHGILRGNRKPPLLDNCFKPSDPRTQYSLQNLDPRIHFALNCGAQSCPPIRLYQPNNLDQGLDLSTKNFLETEKGITINKERREVILSKLFNWYSADFGKNPIDILKWCLKYMEGEKKASLDYLLKNPHTLTIKYHDYKWTSNDKKRKE